MVIMRREGGGRARQSQNSRTNIPLPFHPRPEENSIRGHFDVSSLAESSDTRPIRHFLHREVGTAVFLFGPFEYTASPSPSRRVTAAVAAVAAPRRLRARNLDSFIPLPISCRAFSPAHVYGDSPYVRRGDR